MIYFCYIPLAILARLPIDEQRDSYNGKYDYEYDIRHAIDIIRKGLETEVFNTNQQVPSMQEK